MFIWELQGEKKGQVHNDFFHIFSAVWLHSFIHMCREIKIRCLQNENPGSSPARPWYYAGNIKSIPRFRHLSAPKKEKKRNVLFCLEPQSVCRWHPSFMAQTRCLSYWDEEIPVGGHSRESPPPTLSKVRLIYISQTCSFLLRNGFSWSVAAGSLSACYHSAGTAQPSSQMAVFQRNKTYELNFISLSGLWYVESPRFISTLIPTPVYCFGSLMHEGGFRNWILPGIYNCMFYPSLELQQPPAPICLPLSHTGFP